MSGAELICVPLVPPEFNFDPAVLEAAFAQGAKALVLCNPSNPCGKVFTLEEMQIIADLAKRFDAYVITDEVYEHIVYAPHVHRYISALPGSRFFREPVNYLIRFHFAKKDKTLLEVLHRLASIREKMR